MACQVPSALVPAARDSSSRRAVLVVRRSPENTSCSCAGDDLLGEVQRVGPRQQREQPALVHAVVEQQLLLVVGGGLELAAPHGVLRSRSASATLAALMPAPPTQTRPWTRVPSIVKKRRFGFSIALS